MTNDTTLASLLGRNVRQLREARGLTQAQVARLAGLPRATWANVESGEANPTLAVLHRLGNALQVTLEELVATPHASAQHYPKGALPERARAGGAIVRKLLPDAIPGMEIDRIELPARATMVGVPHTPGTREYLACENGRIVLAAAGEQWTLETGDVVAFNGDQKHSYRNPDGKTSVGYSVVVLARVSGTRAGAIPARAGFPPRSFATSATASRRSR